MERSTHASKHSRNKVVQGHTTHTHYGKNHVHFPTLKSLSLLRLFLHTDGDYCLEDYFLLYNLLSSIRGATDIQDIHNVFKQTPRIKRYISGPPYQLQSWAKQLIGDEAFSFGDKQIYWPDHCTGIKCVPYYYWGWGDGSYSYIIGLKPFFIKKIFLALGAKDNFIRVDNPWRSQCVLKNSENSKTF